MTSAPRKAKSVHSPDQTAFCELMVSARKAAGLTQHALAVRLNKPSADGEQRHKIAQEPLDFRSV